MPKWFEKLFPKKQNTPISSEERFGVAPPIVAYTESKPLMAVPSREDELRVEAHGEVVGGNPAVVDVQPVRTSDVDQARVAEATRKLAERNSRE